MIDTIFRSWKRLPHAIVTLLVVPVFLFLPFTSMQGAVKSSALMQEYVVTGEPFNVVVEAPGRIWFTMPSQNAIGSLVVTSNQDPEFTQYDLPTAISEPYDLVYDPAGVIWFTQLTGNRIGRLDVQTGSIIEYEIPTANSAPTGIALDPDGKVWFAERDGNKLGKFDPNTSTFTEYDYHLANVQAEDVVVQPSRCAANEGCIWSTAPSLNQMIGLTLATETFFNRETSDLAAGIVVQEPWNATIDAGGGLWVAMRAGNRVGFGQVGTLGFWRWFNAPTENSAPTGITFSSKDSLQYIWFTESNAGCVGQLVLSAGGKQVSLREQPLPSANSQPVGLAVDAQGVVWIADKNNQKIVRWSPPYFHNLYLPLAVR